MNPSACAPRTIRCAAFVLGLCAAPSIVGAQVEILLSPIAPQLTLAEFGHGVSPVRDVDGDGNDDLIISAPQDGMPGASRGRVYIYSGATRQPIRTFTAPVPGLTAYGLNFGALWDVDLDGRGDLVVASAAEPPPPGSQISGRMHIYSGASGELLLTIADYGQTAFCGMRPVLGLPDIDGDGRSDVVVSYDYLGCYYSRFHRSSDGALLYETPVYGVGTPFVRAIAEMPDLDGDGIADLALGMPSLRESTEDPRWGRIIIVSGATGALIREIHNPLWMVPTTGNNFGSALATIGDLDGDNVPDLLIGDPLGRIDSIAPIFSGVAFIISGGTGALLHTIAPPVPLAHAEFGGAVAAIPDIDGDGRRDVVIAAPQETPPGGMTRAGAVYIFSGATGQLLRAISTPNPWQLGHFGWAVSRFPEWRPNRRATIAIAAPNEWGSRGRVYLYAACKSDADANGLINQQDIARFINGWLLTIGTPAGTLPPPGVHHGDYNGDGVVNSQDIAAFITDWVSAVQENGCP